MRTICCIDAKSFFASCECVYRGLDPFKTPLVVTDLKRGDNGIVLAITPFLKSLGVNSRCRIKELPKDIEIIYAKPRMKNYLKTSMNIINVYIEYVSQEDIFVYSVDEVFIDLTSYLKLYNTSAFDFVNILKSRVFNTTGISVSIGIGDNMVLAKFAMDIESKHTKDGIAYWSSSDVETKLWNICKLQKIWGIGNGLATRLDNIGIRNVRQLAKTNRDTLFKYLGKVGYKLHDLANGVDNTIISRDIRYKLPKSIGNSQMLYKNIDSKNAKLLLREMIEVIVLKLRLKNYLAKSVHIFVKYSFDKELDKFSKSITLDFPTDNSKVFIDIVHNVVDAELEAGMIRQLGVSLGHIEIKNNVQLDLFSDYEKNSNIENAMLELKEKYGESIVMFATSKLGSSTAYYRSKLVGGHNGEYDDE